MTTAEQVEQFRAEHQADMFVCATMHCSISLDACRKRQFLFRRHYLKSNTAHRRGQVVDFYGPCVACEHWIPDDEYFEIAKNIKFTLGGTRQWGQKQPWR